MARSEKDIHNNIRSIGKQAQTYIAIADEGHRRFGDDMQTLVNDVQARTSRIKVDVIDIQQTMERFSRQIAADLQELRDEFKI
jgi:hypothetical protein